jgi:cytochrome c
MSNSDKDSLLGNKIAAAVLTAGLVFWAGNRIAEIFVPDEAPKTPAIPVAALAVAAAPVTAAAPAVSIETLLASADASKGQAVFSQQCSACHTITKGGAAGVGPNLYGIVGAKAFSQPGFTYSGAVASKAGTPWSFDALSDWLKAPNAFAPGTAMSFAGMKNDQTRADVIAYLNKSSDAPAKLP